MMKLRESEKVVDNLNFCCRQCASDLCLLNVIFRRPKDNLYFCLETYLLKQPDLLRLLHNKSAYIRTFIYYEPTA